MNLKRGIKKFGPKAVEALMKEFLQFEELDIYEGIMANTLTPEQKKRALRAINIIKLKRNGILKGRTVGDGRMQRKYFTKEETSSPTPANDSFMMPLVIDAMERRIVRCGDIPALQARMKDFTVLKYIVESVDILCKVEPKY